MFTTGAPLRKALAHSSVQLSALVHSGYPGLSPRAGVLPEASTVGFWDAAGPRTLVALPDLIGERQVPPDPAAVPTRRSAEFLLGRPPGRAGERWTLDAMAAQCGLAPSAFTGYGRRVANLWPVRCLDQCRIEAAKWRLAAQAKRSITDIALNCGFQSSQRLFTAFRRAVGCSPRAFHARRPDLAERVPPRGRGVAQRCSRKKRLPGAGAMVTELVPLLRITAAALVVQADGAARLAFCWSW